VVPLLTSHDSDADPAYKFEIEKKGFAKYPYLITLEAADRDLMSAIQHEHFCGRDFEKIKMISKQILEALEHMHGLGIIHGDVKPLNIVRSGGRFKLIDLGASVKLLEFAGTTKTSTAFLPPEMVFKKLAIFHNDIEAVQNEVKKDYFSQLESQDYTLSMKTGLPVFPQSKNRIENAEDFEVKIDEGPNFDKSASRKTKAKEDPTVEVLPADPSMDIWAFGLVLYFMATGETLFPTDINDNMELSLQLRLLAPFPDKFKAERLAKCKDHWTRNLIFQCLSLDPRRRPSAREALNHPYFTGVPANIASVYRMPGQACKYDVCLVYSTASHAQFRRSIRHKQFRAKVDAERAEKERIDAEEVAKMKADHAKSKNHFLQIDFKPTSPPWVEPEEPQFVDCDQEEEIRFLTPRLEAMGLKLCHCDGGKGLLTSRTALIVLSRNCINNPSHPQQNVLNFSEHANFDPYFFELRLALEMQAQSYLEGGVISLAVGDKEEGEAKLQRLFSEKTSRDRANAIAEERQRARNLALEKDNKRKEAAARSRARKRDIRAGNSSSTTSATNSSSGSPHRDTNNLSPMRETKESGTGRDRDRDSDPETEDEERVHNKFFDDEEILRTMSLSPSYLPYYASVEGELLGKFGGAHPGGELCLKPVLTVEQATETYLRTYFLGKVPIINGASCSPAKIMTGLTCAQQVLVIGEQEKAWNSASAQIRDLVMNNSAENIAAEVAAEEQDQARMKAVAKFLKQQIELKNGEIELLAKEAEAAQKQMQDKVDELHLLHQKYSIF
jgi:serine/threonine protein kinase